MLRDLKLSLRRLSKTPGFTISAVIVLALGIGVNVTVFDLVHTLFFAPPAFSKPSELVQIFSQDKTDTTNFRAFSHPTYRDIREQNGVFTDVLGFNVGLVGLGQKGDTRRTFASMVSSNYFSVLGVPLTVGRTFTPEEEVPGHPAPVAIVSYVYWQKHNLDPAVLGSQLLIDGHPFTVVGITPRGFTGTMQVFSIEVWTPLSVYNDIANDFSEQSKTPLGDRTGQQLMLIGRLKPGMTEASVKPKLVGLAANLEKAFPVEQKDQTFTTTPISRFSISTSPSNDSGLTAIAPLLFGMAAVVLLVACLNLANMLLARGISRRREIAIRLAIGSNRSQVIRQLLLEGFVLALAGGAAGLTLGVWSTRLITSSLVQMLPFDIYWGGGFNGPIFLAALGFCSVATLVFALGPALKLSHSDIAHDLKEQAADALTRRRGRLLGENPLVIVQIAFSLVLLTAAALFIHGANKAASVDTGLRPGASLIVETDASLAGFKQDAAEQLYRNLRTQLGSIPGVDHAAFSATVPFGMLSLSRNIQRAGLSTAPGSKPATAAEGLAFSATWNSVSADYFETVGLPILRGRSFSETETTQSSGPVVAIMDQILAKKLWPDGDALGQYVQYAADNAPRATDQGSGGPGMNADMSGKTTSPEMIQIVGIVPTVRRNLSQDNPTGQIYLPFAHGFQSDVSYFVRFRSISRDNEEAAASMVRRTVIDVNPALPILSLKTFEQHLTGNLQIWILRAGAALFSAFGGLALGLAVVGLYGVKAYSVARRTREIGIRLALGAERGEILRMFLRESVVTLSIGIVLGLLLAALTGKLLSGMLYQISPLDPVSFITAPLVLAVAALIATWLPARRATRIAPTEALRTE